MCQSASTNLRLIVTENSAIKFKAAAGFAADNRILDKYNKQKLCRGVAYGKKLYSNTKAKLPAQ